MRGLFFLENRISPTEPHVLQHLAWELSRYLKAGFSEAQVLIVQPEARAQQAEQRIGDTRVRYQIIPSRVGADHVEETFSKLRQALPPNLAAASLHGHLSNVLLGAPLNRMGLPFNAYSEKMALPLQDTTSLTPSDPLDLLEFLLRAGKREKDTRPA